MVGGDTDWGLWDSIVSVPKLLPITTYPTPERGTAFQAEGAGCAKAWREELLNRPVYLGQVGTKLEERQGQS